MAFRRRKSAVAFAVILLLAVAAWAVPMTRARIKAAAVLPDAAGAPIPRPFAGSVEIEPVELSPGISGDLYVVDEGDPAVVFVPGATRRGRDDPRVIRAATALAKARRRVFVPELNLYRRTFDRSDIGRITASIEALSRGGPVGVLGFSYGGSFALIAGADPRSAGRVSYIATFGAYFDLRHVIQGVATGFTILDGDRVRFTTVPEAREILTSTTLRLAPEGRADDLERAVEAGDPRQLPRAARSLYALLSHRDPARTDRLVAATPPRFRRALEYFSPATYVDRLTIPVFILQSKKDAATPWTEAILLERAVGSSRLVMLDHFSHVDPPGTAGWLADGPRAWRFLSWVLEAQE